jgi:chromosome segregation ATPase
VEVTELFELYGREPSDALAAALRNLATSAGDRAVRKQLFANFANKKAFEVQDLTLALARAEADEAGVVERNALRAKLAAARAECEEVLRTAQRASRRELAETQSALTAGQAALKERTAQKALADAECGALGSALQQAEAKVHEHEVYLLVLAEFALRDDDFAQSCAARVTRVLNVAIPAAAALQTQHNEALRTAEEAGEEVVKKTRHVQRLLDKVAELQQQIAELSAVLSVKDDKIAHGAARAGGCWVAPPWHGSLARPAP